MRRTWINALLVYNAVLAIVLSFYLLRWVERDRPAKTGPAGPVQVHVLQQPNAILVEFGAPVRAGADDGEDVAPAASAVTLTPPTRIRQHWHTPSLLEIRPVDEFRPATRYRVHVAPSLRAIDGRKLGTDSLAFVTDVPKVEGCVVETQSRTPTLVLGFTQSVPRAELVRVLAVHRPNGTPVPFEVVTQTDSAPKVFRIKLNAGTERLPRVRVDIAAGMRGLTGELRTIEPWSRVVSLATKLRWIGISAATNGIEIRLDRRIPLPERNTISVEPVVDFQVKRTWRGFRLLGSFEAGMPYRVRLAKGFPGVGVARLDLDDVRSVRVDDLKPSLRFVQQGDVLSSKAERRLRFEAVNVSEAVVSVRRAYANNMVRLAEQRRSPPPVVFAPGHTRRIKLGGEPNERREHTIELDEFLDGAKSGMYFVEVRDARYRAWRITKLLQITDLGVTARVTDDAVAVWVAGLAHAQPVRGADVRVWTRTNQPIARGKTKADGTVVLSYAKTQEDHVPFLIEVRSGDDVSFIDLDHHQVELADAGLGGRAAAAGPEAWIYFDRGIVRPGAHARATIVVRDENGVAPSRLPLDLQLFDPLGRKRQTVRVHTSGEGLVLFDHDFRASAATGTWELRAIDSANKTLGAAPLRVEAFVPDRLEVHASLGHLKLGDRGLLAVDGTWLDGSSAAKRPVRALVRYLPAKFQPKGFEGWSFGFAKAEPLRAAKAKGVLDAAGKARLAFALPAPRDGGQCFNVRASVELLDPSGRAVHCRTEKRVIPANGILGVLATEHGASVIVVDADGTLVRRARRVRVDLERRRWNWRFVPGGRGRFRYETYIKREVVATQEVDLRGRADVTLQPTGQQSGWFTVVATAADGAMAEQDLGDVPRRPDRLRVQARVEPVLPGHTTKFALESPFAGRACVSLEGSTVESVAVVDVPAGHSEHELRIPAGTTRPNLHVVVTLRARQAVASGDGPFWLTGGASIPVAHPERAACVTLTAPERIVPGERIVARVHAPGTRRAVFMLVDEGVLRVSAHPDPDPVAYFGAARRLESRGADTGRRLLSGVRFSPAVLAGGDGELAERLAGTMSREIRGLALFVGPVILDASGSASVVFDPPNDFEGRLRLSVIAVGSRAVGAASRAVTVRAPLGLAVAMPRVSEPGDRLTLTVTAKNGTEHAGRVALQVAAIGSLGVHSTPGTLAFDLAAGATKSVAIPVLVGRGRTPQGLRVTGTLGKNRRVVEGRFSVRRPGVLQIEHIGIANREHSTIAVSRDWSGTVSGRLVISTSPDARLAPALEALIDYPHGCVEQTSSRGLALLACQSLSARMHPEGGADATQAMIRSGVDRVLSMQVHTGGLGMWPSSTSEYAFGTVYGLDFLLSARALGYDVDAAALHRITNRVATLLRHSSNVGLQCFAVEVLSRAQRRVAAALQRLGRVATTTEQRALLGLASARLHRAEATNQAPTAPAGEAEVPRDHGGLLRSRTRTDALELRRLLALGRDDPRIIVLARRLERALLRPRRRTTQELAQALRAVAEFWRRNAVEPGAFELVAHVGGHEFRTRGEPIALQLEPGANLRLESTVPVWGVLELKGQRTSGAGAPLPGLDIVRRVLDSTNGKLAKRFVVGRVYDVVIAGKADVAFENLLITELLPGGFEVEPARDVRSSERDRLHVESRDDRVLLFRRAPCMAGSSGATTFEP